ncbi:mechanosensitive ion channel family protein [Hydrogenivirga sp.]
MDDRVLSFLSETLTLLKLFALDVSEDFLREVAYLFTLTGGYIFLMGLIRGVPRRVLGFVSPKFLELSLALAAYGLVSVLVHRLPDINSLIILKAVLYTDILRTLTGLASPYLRAGFMLSAALRTSILLSGVFLFLQYLAADVDPKAFEHQNLGYKLSTALFTTLFLVGLFRHSLEAVRHDILRRVLRRSAPVLFLLYAFVTLSWILGTVELSQDFVVKLVLTVGVLVGYFSLQVYLMSQLEKRLGESFSLIKDSLRKFLLLFALFILYKELDLLFAFGGIKSILGSLYVVNTELVKISLLSIIESVYVFLLLWTLTGFIKNLVYIYYMNRDMEVEAGSFRALVSNVGILLAFSMSLVELGITWKVMVPLAGALGIGLGFGLQTIFNNYVSGFILLLSKNIKVGDLVEIEGSAGYTIGRRSETVFGKVVNISILTTVIRTNDNLEVAIPNSEFISGRIINYSLSDPYIRVRIPFGVSYSSDPKKVKEILLRVAQESNLVLEEPRPNVWFYEMGDSALIFYLLVWVDIRKFWRMRALRSEIYFKAWEELKKEGIEIPFPQRDVWFKNPLKVEIDERGLPEGGSDRG